VALTDTSTFQIRTIDPAELDQVRQSDRDISGHPVEHVVARGAEPLRWCLSGAVAGEEIILFGYEPPLPASPYREIGAVFAHAVRCAGPGPADEYPPAWRGRPQVLRAYDGRGWIHAATTHDGSDPERAIAELLSDPEIVQIHSRNIAYGCYMFTVTGPG
jgi:hypothetical protein